MTGPGNSGFPCGIDALQVLETHVVWSVATDLMSVGNYATGVEKAHTTRNIGAPV